MIAELSEAIKLELRHLPGVAECRDYAGELDPSVRAILRVPSLLLALRKTGLEPDAGTGELDAWTHWSLLVCNRHAGGIESRGAETWALAELVMLHIRAQTWGLAGVSPALIDPPGYRDESPSVTARFELEHESIAVREIRWSQRCRIGSSCWDGDGVQKEEVYLNSLAISSRPGTARIFPEPTEWQE